MAQSRSGVTDFAHGAQDGVQTVHRHDNQGVSQPGSSAMGANDLHRANSTMSQTNTLTPSRGGTLKKRQSLSRKNSLKRSGSKKGSRPGSVRSMTFADDVNGHGSEMNSAFYTPVPTTGTPTEILANRFQGMSLSCNGVAHRSFPFTGVEPRKDLLSRGIRSIICRCALTFVHYSLAEGTQRLDHVLYGHQEDLRSSLQVTLYPFQCRREYSNTTSIGH